MNNLHRELAPISDAAWAQIEEETARTFKRYLAGRRVVDVAGPAGNYDRILDFSRAVTGSLFFVPSETLLESLGEDPPAPATDPAAEVGPPSPPRPGDGSLGIGSLKGEFPHE